ncbi:MAG: FG-GAP-like repeat-containing protein [Desulfobacterales bacterium]
MKPKLWGIIVFLVCAMVVGTPAAFAAGGSEVYVAAATQKGQAAYMVLNPDGTFSNQVDMQLTYPWFASGDSYGNAIGDFDNDGDLDYITARGGFKSGNYYSNIYIFEKLDSVDQVAPFAYVNKEDDEPGGSTWAIEGLPGDMAVADFNGDGNLDFVLNHYRTPHCGLYLGNGHLGFDLQLLSDTTPDRSIGVDAADFNNDGKADFVIAPNDSDKPLYVYLGNGDGTFEQKTSDRDPGASPGYGIAAGDFVKDPDGIVDLAVSDTGLLEIYKGDGEGSFSYYSSIVDSPEDPFPMKRSPLDNIDFDRDGDQDLVVANFGDDSAGVAVLELIDDQGNFEHSGTYPGGDVSGSRKALTALPYLPNKKPVAILTPETITVKVGEAVEWDAAESFDEDGTIVSYEWDYGDGVVSPLGVNTLAKSSTDGNSGGAQSSYVYSDSGTYFVTLTVTDDQGATDTVQAEVDVEALLSVSVYFSPSKLNLKSREKWLTATLIMPPEYDARMIDPDSLYIVLEEGKAEFKAHPVYRHGFFSRHDQRRSRGIRKLTVKFDRQALIEELDGATGETILNVTGLISSNVSEEANFSGAGTIKVYEKERKINSYRMYLMKLIMRFFSKGG